VPFSGVSTVVTSSCLTSSVAYARAVLVICSVFSIFEECSR
jgi:hypothetical protein